MSGTPVVPSPQPPPARGGGVEAALNNSPPLAGGGGGGVGRLLWPWLLVPVAAALLPWLFYDFSHARHAGFVVSMLSQMGMMVIFALSYNMLMGQAGLLSFGHAAFFGFGGYCAAHLMSAAGAGGLPVPLELTPLLAGLAGLGLAIPLGFVATRQRAIAFAMITLGIGELMTAAAMMFHHFFGGEGGVTTDRQTGISLIGASYAQGIQVYYLILAWAVLATAGMRFLTSTPLGRMANACRDNQERAQFVGYDPRMVRFLQFALSGFFAGIGGGLYAITYEIVTYDALAAPLSGNALLMAYVGGGTSFVRPDPGRGAHHRLAERGQSAVELLGYLCGSAVHRHGDIRAGRTDGTRRGAWADRPRRPAAQPGAALPAPARAGPLGGAGLRRRGGAALVPHHRRGRGQDARPVRPRHRRPRRRALGHCGRGAGGGRGLAAARGARVPPRLGRRFRQHRRGPVMAPPPIRLTEVCKSFGATEVIRGVSLMIRPGERHALIGPNGAGKTTLFNLISGRFPLSSGQIHLGETRIDALPPHRINRLGLSRSFQITSIFHRLSVFENLRCSLLWSRGYRYSFWYTLGRQPALNAEAKRLLEAVGLAGRRDVPAGLLSYAEQRALEIGMTVAGGAEAVLLDEPTAGMSHTETEQAVALIRRLTQDRTLLMVEHDMRVVFDLADTITVLVYGQVIESGPPAGIRASRAVQEAYLGAPA